MNSDSRRRGLEQFGGELAQEGTCPLGPWFTAAGQVGQVSFQGGTTCPGAGARQWALGLCICQGDGSVWPWRGWGGSVGAGGLAGNAWHLRSWPRARRAADGPWGQGASVQRGDQSPSPMGWCGPGVHGLGRTAGAFSRLTPSGRDTEDARGRKKRGWYRLYTNTEFKGSDGASGGSGERG